MCNVRGLQSQSACAHTHTHTMQYIFALAFVAFRDFCLDCVLCVCLCVCVIDSSSIDKSELRGRAESEREGGERRWEVGLAHTARGRFIFCIIEMRLPKCSQKLCEPK